MKLINDAYQAVFEGQGKSNITKDTKGTKDVGPNLEASLGAKENENS